MGHKWSFITNVLGREHRKEEAEIYQAMGASSPQMLLLYVVLGVGKSLMANYLLNFPISKYSSNPRKYRHFREEK